MNSNLNDLATRFLLGELSEAERREVEERFLGDNEFFEQVLASEDALLDEYLSGTLSEEQQLRAKMLFESSREQREHVERTKQLLARVKSGGPEAGITQPPPNVGPRISTLAWATLGLFVLLGSWALYLAYRQRNLSVKEAAAEQSVRQINEALNAEFARRDRLQEELESERRKNEELLAQLQSEGQPSTTVTLKPQHFERSDQSTLQTVKVDTPQIKIHLVLESDARYERYDVAITTFGGREVQKLSLNANQVARDMLTMTLPVSIFGSDDFKIDLRGAFANGQSEHLADYAFRLTR